jgi:sugar O-acyltransferase (sialic acid O-acetyltransferase NeuD family)
MQLVIVGAGGHGKVVLDIVRAAGAHTPIGFVDADLTLTGKTIAGLPVLGPMNVLPRLRQQRVTHAIVAIGDNRTRLRYAGMLRGHGFELANAIHPSAVVAESAKLGRNIVIAAQSAVCVDCQVGDSVIVNTGAIVDHECQIGAGVHICPGARIAGRVQIGEAAFIGLGTNVIQCLAIGEDAIVGAGAVVLKDVPAGATFVGVPARLVSARAVSVRADLRNPSVQLT